MHSWDEIAALVEEICGDNQVDWDERFFYCPFCDEIIYETDYPEIGDFMCPICCEVI